MKPGVCDNFKFTDSQLAKKYTPQLPPPVGWTLEEFTKLTGMQRDQVRRTAKRAVVRKLALLEESKLEIKEDRSISEMLGLIAKRHDLTLAHITGERRSPNIFRARLEAYDFLLTKFPDFSFFRVGRLLGGRDHSTVSYANKKIKSMKQRGEWPPV